MTPQTPGIYFARSSKPPDGWAKDAYDLLIWVTGEAPFLRVSCKIDAHTLEPVIEPFRSPKVWGPKLVSPRIEGES